MVSVATKAKITDARGNDMKLDATSDAALTFGDVVIYACQNPLPGDNQISVKDKVKIGRLAIDAAVKEEMILEAEDVALIKSRVAAALSPVVLARVVDLIDPSA